MKKLITLLLVVVMALGLVACNKDNGGETGELKKSTANYRVTTVEDYANFTAPADFKVGFIFLHDENSTYDKNFYDAAVEAVTAMGLSSNQVLYKFNIPESTVCYDTAADLVDEGCDLIFANSFGHEAFIKQAAAEFTDVEFCHATGTNAIVAGLANYHNAFASIYEGRYLAGIAAGMKLNEMIEEGKFTAAEAKMGYVGAFPYAEVKSGYTSFYLGAKSVCPTVTMEVTFTSSWYDETKEKEAANTLISRGCKLISQHADSWGAPTACEQAGVPNVSYNGSTVERCPNTFIVSSRINWAPYFKYIIAQAATNKAIAVDWCGTIATGSVLLTDVNTAVAAEGTAEAIATAKAAIENGTLNVYDVTKDNYITVNGQKLTSQAADIEDMGDFVPETEAVVDGYYHESVYRSAPSFDVTIDGITLLN